MKARRRVFSGPFDAPAEAESAPARNAKRHSSLGLTELDLRILAELSKVRHSRLSDAIANSIRDRRVAVDASLRRMLELGLVRQPKDSKRGFKITESGRAALSDATD